MKKTGKFTARERIVRLLLLLADRPHQYTKKELAERLEDNEDNIKGDFEVLRALGFRVTPDRQYRYAITNQKQYPELDSLLLFSAADQMLLRQGIDQLKLIDRHKNILKDKLTTLYDFRQMGHAFLREPHLEKINQLMAAKADKKQVILEEYRSSNSNTKTNRQVEPFKINIEEDTVQTFDVERQKVNHFRISRATRVVVTDQPWQHEAQHVNREIDPFRIVNDDQVTVHLRLNLAAYNELIERFPTTKRYIEDDKTPNMFDFHGKVNRQFLGLSNFILGFFHYGAIEVLSPESLRQHLQDELGKITF
jgi:predicted DNA-binding transcriptional regulator YafY